MKIKVTFFAEVDGEFEADEIEEEPQTTKEKLHDMGIEIASVLDGFFDSITDMTVTEAKEE